MIFGYIELIGGLIRRIEEELGSKVKVIATGGQAYPFVEDIAAIDIINPNLTLIGLRLIYEMNREQ